MSLEQDDLEVAIEAKNAGTVAWGKGDFNEAIECFSNAITATPDVGNKEFFKILYSNRSAAYLKVGRTTEALGDANKCIQLDQNWPKGYSRKGDALLSSKEYTDAYNAYNTGLRVAPNDKTLKEKAEQAMRALANVNERTSSSSSSSSSSSATTASQPMSTPQKYLKLGSLLCSFLYLLPIGFISLLCYRACAVTSGLATLAGLYSKHGFPKFNTEYGMKVISDQSTLRLFLSVYLLMTRPYVLALCCQVLPDLTSFTAEICQYGLQNVSAVEDQLKGFVSRFAGFAPQLAAQLSNVPLARLLEPSQVKNINQGLLSLGCTFEVYQGIFLVIELMLPTRNPIMLYIWWQYLQMRYMLDQTGVVKNAFKDMDQKVTTLVGHKYCPSIVGKGYGLLKSFLQKQVQIPGREDGGAGGGGFGSMVTSGVKSAMSKCSVM